MRAGSGLFADAVKWGEVVGELSQLFPLHWQEVGMGLKLNMNYKAYAQAERQGGLAVVVLRAGKEIVGYWTVAVSPFLHSCALRAGYTDLVFVKKEFRSRVAWKLLHDRMQQILLAKGVALWFVGTKARRSIGPLLERYGFELEELSYCKRL